MADTLANIIHREPVSILTDCRDASPELERIVNRSLAKNADERYQSAAELLTDLKQLQKRLEFESQLERSSTPNVEDASTQIISTGKLEASSVPATQSNANRDTAPTTCFHTRSTEQIEKPKDVVHNRRPGYDCRGSHRRGPELSILIAQEAAVQQFSRSR